MASWDSTYKNAPADDDDFGDGASEIRDLKIQFEAGYGKEHDMTTLESGAFSFRHGSGSARMWVGTTFPTTKPGSGAVALDDEDIGRQFHNTSVGITYVLVDINASDEPVWYPIDGLGLGDLVYTVIVPDSSRRLYPCDGSTITKGTVALNGVEDAYDELITKLQTTAGAIAGGDAAKVPDFRGVTLRGMNTMRYDIETGAITPNPPASDHVDPDTGRAVGSQQGDLAGAHTHTLTTDEDTELMSAEDGEHYHDIPLAQNDAWKDGGQLIVEPTSDSDFDERTKTDGAHSHNIAHQHTATTDENVGAETRMANTAVYVYIRY
jgi:hypothetical protein